MFFQYLGRKVINEVDLSKPLESVFYGYAKDTINKYWVEYEKILSHYVDEAAIIGNVHYDILLEASKDKAKHFKATKARNTDRTFLDNELNVDENKELFAPNPKVSSRLKRYKFEASDKTMARVDKEINQILGEAYREGWGPRDVGQKIQQRFTDLSTYESRRIAQTEINTTRNYVQYQRMQDDEMEYKIWHAAHDSRTRKSHLDVDEEIVPINERFSNGLLYPGDKEGPISEWVNCRCSHAAYIMPLGYEAPDFFPFTESDLIKVGSSLSQDYVSEIQERIRLIDGAMVREQEESKIEKPPVVEPFVAPKPKPKKPKKPKVPEPKPVKPKVEINDKIKQNLTDVEYKNYKKLSEDIIKYEELLKKIPKGNPRIMMYEAKLKSARRRLARLEQSALKPVTTNESKPKYPVVVETSQRAVEIKEEVGAKRVYSQTHKNKHTYDLYEFDEFTVAMDRDLINSKSLVTVDEIKKHLNSLPKELRNTNAKIYITNTMNLEASGNYFRFDHEVEIYNNGNRIVKPQYDVGFQGMETITILDVITHEVAHSYDLKKYKAEKGNVATIDAWGKMVKEDNKLYRYKDPNTGRMRTPKKFPTGYASSSWYSASRSGNYDKIATQYCEDFAESTKLYLNPKYHDKFVKEFPNRAKFLENCFGKPDFKNNIIHTIK